MRFLFAIVFLIGLITLPPSGLSKTSSDQLQAWARELAQLRSEVGTLESRIQTERERNKAALRGLEQRKSELEIRLDADLGRISTAQREISAIREAIAARNTAVGSLEEPVKKAVERLREYVKSGLPFHIEQRMTLLKDIETGLTNNVVSIDQAISRLWRFVEDELRLTADLMRTKVVLNLDGYGKERQMVDVVRVGMSWFYTLAPDGRVGRLWRDGGAFNHEWIEDQESTESIKNLFANLSKGVNHGLYRLALPAVGEVRQ